MEEFNALDRIYQLCAERNWTCYKLSKASGIPYSTLNTMLNKHNAPSLPTLQKICVGFGISLTDFFDPDRSHRGLTDEQSQCLALFSSLSPEERRLALAYMKGLARK